MRMELSDFLDGIRELNRESYNFGNEILYKMASDCDDLHDAKKLTGSLWLIGRSYSASPQRRSYKKAWIPKSSNDGRDNFFSKIAEPLSHSSCFDDLIEAYNEENLTYTFESQEGRAINDSDKALLAKTINTVISFNSALSAAIEEFDEVPDGHRLNGKEIKCNNHISFSSKFLHFYFPNAVFIIDSYAHSGGAALFNGNANLTDGANNSKTKLRNLCTPPKNENEVKDYFLDSVYRPFDKEEVNRILEEIEPEINVSARCGDREVESNEQLSAKNYVYHCVRSYLVCKFFKNGQYEGEIITPSVQIEGEEDFTPWTRLLDTVFLNIKKPLTNSESDKIQKNEEMYYAPARREREARENS